MLQLVYDVDTYDHAMYMHLQLIVNNDSYWYNYFITMLPL